LFIRGSRRALANPWRIRVRFFWGREKWSSSSGNYFLNTSLGNGLYFNLKITASDWMGINKTTANWGALRV